MHLKQNSIIYNTFKNTFRGHRHHRSTDQGLDEDEPEDEIQTDENDEVTEEPGSRKRRNTDTPMPSFPSDHDSEHSNSVGTFVIICYHCVRYRSFYFFKGKMNMDFD